MRFNLEATAINLPAAKFPIIKHTRNLSLDLKLLDPVDKDCNNSCTYRFKSCIFKIPKDISGLNSLKKHRKNGEKMTLESNKFIAVLNSDTNSGRRAKMLRFHNDKKPLIKIPKNITISTKSINNFIRPYKNRSIFKSKVAQKVEKDNFQQKNNKLKPLKLSKSNVNVIQRNDKNISQYFCKREEQKEGRNVNYQRESSITIKPTLHTLKILKKTTKKLHPPMEVPRKFNKNSLITTQNANLRYKNNYYYNRNLSIKTERTERQYNKEHNKYNNGYNNEYKRYNRTNHKKTSHFFIIKNCSLPG